MLGRSGRSAPPPTERAPHRVTGTGLLPFLDERNDMPKIRQGRYREQSSRITTLNRSTLNRVDPHDAGRTCIAHDGECPRDLVPGSPVRLCGHHLREVYEFAQDLVTDRWDGAVRDYVSELHNTFTPPAAVKKRPRPGFVYFIRFGNQIKVGFTTNVEQRMRDLPHEEILGVVPGTLEDEAAWHKMLAEYRTVGEWFRAEPEVLDALERVVSAQAS